MTSEKILAYFIAIILDQSPSKCLSLKEIYDSVEQDFDISQEWYNLLPLGQAYNELKKKGLSKKDLSGISTEPKWRNTSDLLNKNLSVGGGLKKVEIVEFGVIVKKEKKAF